MAESSCLLSLPSLFTTKPTTTSHSLSLPLKPKQLSQHHHLSISSLKNKTNFSPLITPFASQTSDWAQTDEDSTTTTATLSGSEQDASSWGNLQENEDSGETAPKALDWGGFGQTEEADSAGASEGGEEFVEPPEEAKIFVGNLPYDVDSEKLAMLFEQAGTVEISEVIYNRETDSSRGFGFVTMQTVEEAEKAVDMFSGYDMQGRLLTVNKAAPRGERLERTPRVSQPGFKIYVGNLAWGVDNARLEQVFSEHGKVVDARVVYERESGRSRGFGFVTMSTETELNDAIAALDGQSLDGRAIRVNMAESRPRRF